jgi:UTP--glucose-1-phosphate uridylyltransferase
MKTVIPVVGHETRFLPITKSQPKEMLPVVDKPAIHYLINRTVSKNQKTKVLILRNHIQPKGRIFTHV